jgi:hypothetical protein
METALITAIVAASISLISVIVNLLIAREARRGAKSQIKFQLALKYVEKSVTILKDYMKEIEKVRIACWQLEFEFNPILEEKINVDKIKERAENFKTEFDKFYDDWSEAKGEMTDLYIMNVRQMRHGCKNEALELSIKIKKFLKEYKLKGKENIDKNILDELKNESRSLSWSLNTFYSIINDIKNEKLAEFLFDE